VPRFATAFGLTLTLPKIFLFVSHSPAPFLATDECAGYRGLKPELGVVIWGLVTKGNELSGE